MNRKTNIFYNLSDPDNKFLTFSNYTEYLTGNFLAVNKKLFPSSFICVNIPSDKLHDFKSDLIFYYENKLATLRDALLENDKNVEQELSPLGYLLDLIVYNGGRDAIKYVGDICEQDYNGTYTDIICIIEQYKHFNTYNITNSKYDGTGTKFSNNSGNKVPIEDNLHGWDSYCENSTDETDQQSQYTIGSGDNKINLSLLPEHHNECEWEGTKKEFTAYDPNEEKFEDSEDNEYSSLSIFDSVLLAKDERDINITTDHITFNCVIPLFDVVDIKISKFEYEEQTKDILISNNDNQIQRSIPMGVWINNDYITLKVDPEMKYTPSWSLMITSQFKPFPYSKTIAEKIHNNNKNSFNTFASILNEQANIANMIKELSLNMENMANEIKNIKDFISTNHIGMSEFDLNEKITNLYHDVDNRMTNLKQELDQKYEALKWQTSI